MIKKIKKKVIKLKHKLKRKKASENCEAPLIKKGGERNNFEDSASMENCKKEKKSKKKTFLMLKGFRWYK